MKCGKDLCLGKDDKQGRGSCGRSWGRCGEAIRPCESMGLLPELGMKKGEGGSCWGREEEEKGNEEEKEEEEEGHRDSLLGLEGWQEVSVGGRRRRGRRKGS